jgi:hypothetical protein
MQNLLSAAEYKRRMDGGETKGLPSLDQMEMCWPVPLPRSATTEYRLMPVKAQALELCSTLSQLKIREDLAYYRIAQWNARWPRFHAEHAFQAAAAAGSVTPASPEKAVSAPAGWDRTELRVQEDILALSDYLLPLLLGLIGGGVYVVRRVAEREQTATLAPSEGLSVIGRVILAGIFGGLLAAVFGPVDHVKLGNVTLTVAAAAFFIGYGLESVLKAVDALIDRVTNGPAPGSDAKQSVPMKP